MNSTTATGSDTTRAAISAALTRKLLVIADETPECRVALRYAARRAQHTNGHLALLYVIAPTEFQNWQGVEARMREEAREEAERLLYELAGEATQIAGLVPELVIREGKLKDEIIALTKEDPSIGLMVLAAGTGREGPGPLVSSLASDIVMIYPIPVTIVPGSMTPEAIDLIA